MQIVINTAHGGFQFSDEVIFELIRRDSKIVQSYPIDQFMNNYGYESLKEFRELFIPINSEFSKFKIDSCDCCGFDILYKDRVYDFEEFHGFASNFRNHPDFVSVINFLGEKANTENSKLKIVEIPDDIDFYIDDGSDGKQFEVIHESHRIWM